MSNANSDEDPQKRNPPSIFLARNLSRVPLVRRIPNPSVRQMFRDKETENIIRTRVPGWAGYYNNSDERIHPFLTDLHAPTKYNRDTGFQIVACAGGLILVRRLSRPTDPEPTGESEVVMKHFKTAWRKRLADTEQSEQTDAASKVARKRPSRRKPRNTDNSNSSSSVFPSQTRLQHYGWVENGWERLLIYNLKTNEERPLPNVKIPRRVGPQDLYDYRGVQATIVVEHDSYKVILTFRTGFGVLPSTTRTWQFFHFGSPAVWGMDRIYDQKIKKKIICIPWEWVSAKATLGGRLYFADVVSESHANMYTLRLFELDYNNFWNWTLKNSFPLRKRHWSFLPSTSPNPRSALGREMDDIRSMELVECMGELYAVLLARIDEHLTSEFTSVRTLEELTRDHMPGLAVLPIQFHILRVQRAEGRDDDDDDGFSHRVQRVLVPEELRYCKSEGPLGPDSVDARTDHLLAGFHLTSGQTLANKFHNLFWSAAEGSVIFLAFGDCITKYDVVTGESTTGIVRNQEIMPTYAHHTYPVGGTDVKP